MKKPIYEIFIEMSDDGRGLSSEGLFVQITKIPENYPLDEYKINRPKIKIFAKGKHLVMGEIYSYKENIKQNTKTLLLEFSRTDKRLFDKAIALERAKESGGLFGKTGKLSGIEL